ncbi:MAG: hypothetical protein ABSH47_13275 [Bryobacteraceae bacterium]|jgi:hypothetical protein
MTTDELLLKAPTVIGELSSEFVRRGHECMLADAQSQLTACFLLAIRAISLLCGMGCLLKPNARDSLDVLMRAYIESRDLLMTFRFDDQGIRNKVHAWFLPNGPWKPEHKRVDTFLQRLSGADAELATRWKMMSALSHPTAQAAKNSAAMVAAWAAPGRGVTETYAETMQLKIDDYLVAIGTLIVATTIDRPGWIPLGCDDTRMPNVEPFRLEAAALLSGHR